MKRRGITLIEMVETIALATIILGILTSMLWAMFRLYSVYNARSELTSASVATVTHIGELLYPAHGIETTRIVDGAIYTSDQSTMIIRLAALDVSGNPRVGVYDYVVITRDPLQNNRLLEITDADPTSSRIDGTKLLDESVRDVTFSYRNASPATTDVVFFSVTTRKVVQQTTLTHALHAHAKLRNK